MILEEIMKNIEINEYTPFNEVLLASIYIILKRDIEENVFVAIRKLTQNGVGIKAYINPEHSLLLVDPDDEDDELESIVHEDLHYLFPFGEKVILKMTDELLSYMKRKNLPKFDVTYIEDISANGLSRYLRAKSIDVGDHFNSKESRY